MIKIAENFFHKQIVSLKNLEDFEKTDLFLYFEKLFGEMIWVPETDESKHFFISISKTDGMTLDTYPVKEIPAQFLVRERIFYPKGGGTPIGYWYPKCLSHLEGKTFRWDADRQKGYQLSRYGYLIYKLSSEDKKFLEKIKDYEYEGESNVITPKIKLLHRDPMPIKLANDCGFIFPISTGEDNVSKRLNINIVMRRDSGSLGIT